MVPPLKLKFIFLHVLFVYSYQHFGVKPYTHYLAFKNLITFKLEPHFVILTTSSITMSAPVSNPSLCIPRAFANIDQRRVADVFYQLNLGKISRIDIIQRKNERGEPYNRIFIHFEHWYCNRDAIAAKSKILEGKELKIVYDGLWFWKVSLNKFDTVNQRAHIVWSDDKPVAVPIAPGLPIAATPHNKPKRSNKPPPPPKAAAKAHATAPTTAHTTATIATTATTARPPNKQLKASVADQSATLPVKKRVLTKKVKKEPAAAAKKVVLLELEEGEVDESDAALEKQADALYGDI